MSQCNSTDPNSVINQLIRLFVIPTVRYVLTPYYALSIPVRSCRLSPIDEIASYGDNPGEPCRHRMKQPLYPIAFLASSIAFVTTAGIWTGLIFSSNGDLMERLPDVEWLFYSLVLALVFAIYMVVFTGTYKRFAFFVNYYCYIIGTMWFVLIAFLLLAKFSSEFLLEPIWKINLLNGQYFPEIYYAFGLLSEFYLFVVHPVLAFRNVLGINVCRLILTIFPFGIGVLLLAYVFMG